MLLKRLYFISNFVALVSAIWISIVNVSWVATLSIVLSLFSLLALWIPRIPIPLLAALINMADGLLVTAFVAEGKSSFVLIYVFWIIYFTANTLLIRHRFLEWFLYAFALAPLLFQKSEYILYGSLSFFLVLINWYGSKLVRDWMRKTEEDKQKLAVSLEEITRTHAATRSAIDLATHDIGGIASRLLTQEVEVKNGTTNAASVLAVSQSILDQIIEKLRILRTDEAAEYDLSRIAEMLISKPHIISKVPRIFVRVRLEVFLSILKNLLANAEEAFERRFGNLSGLKILFFVEASTFFIQDNAGGFDIERIGMGVSEKSALGNGIFLYTLLRDAHQHGLEISLKRLPDGTRVGIRFREGSS